VNLSEAVVMSSTEMPGRHHSGRRAVVNAQILFQVGRRLARCLAPPGYEISALRVWHPLPARPEPNPAAVLDAPNGKSRKMPFGPTNFRS
jgi:hypothetical protein